MDSSLLQPLDKHTFWDVWYTGLSPFPSELLNPSPRASILSALLRPYEFTLPLPLPSNKTHPQRELPSSPTVSDVEAHLSSTHFTRTHPSTLEETRAAPIDLHKLPDTSILFARYLDSGRLVNIYDWYGSFKVVLDTQRAERLASRKTRKGRKKTSPKKKSRVKGKKAAGKQKAIEDEEMVGVDEHDEGEEVEEPDEEAWQKEVQARFVRALHELDYLGFIKHTGRRVEHVARTIFDVGDEGEEEEGSDGG
jgi:origin recognition complex subunit 3